jgi:ribulose-phosphate 3-epimerase
MQRNPPFIAPSLLSANFLDLQGEIQAMTSAGADWLHIDVMDGHFVPNLAFGVESIKQIKKSTFLPIDVHLMVNCLDTLLNQLIETQVDSLTIHPEATYHPYRCLQKIKQSNIKTGIALNPGTPVETVYPFVDQLDIVLIMTVNPGFGGQQFLHPMLSKIESLRSFIDRERLSVMIEVDGGINEKTASLVIDAGADILVAGNYLFHKDYPIASAEIYAERIKNLLKRE